MSARTSPPIRARVAGLPPVRTSMEGVLVHLLAHASAGPGLDLHAAMTSLQQSVDEDRIRLLLELRQAQERVQQTDTQMMALRQQHELESTRLQQLQAEVVELRSHEQQTDDLRDRLSTSQASVVDLTERLSGAHASELQAREQLQRAQLRIGELERQLSASDRVLKEALASSKRFESRLVSLEQGAKHAAQSLQESERRARDLDGQLTARTTELSGLRASLARSAEDLRREQQAGRQHATEMERLRHRVQELEKELQQSSESMARVRSVLASMTPTQGNGSTRPEMQAPSRVESSTCSSSPSCSSSSSAGAGSSGSHSCCSLQPDGLADARSEPEPPIPWLRFDAHRPYTLQAMVDSIAQRIEQGITDPVASGLNAGLHRGELTVEAFMRAMAIYSEPVISGRDHENRNLVTSLLLLMTFFRSYSSALVKTVVPAAIARVNMRMNACLQELRSLSGRLALIRTLKPEVREGLRRTCTSLADGLHTTSRELSPETMVTTLLMHVGCTLERVHLPTNWAGVHRAARESATTAVSWLETSIVQRAVTGFYTADGAVGRFMRERGDATSSIREFTGERASPLLSMQFGTLMDLLEDVMVDSLCTCEAADRPRACALEGGDEPIRLQDEYDLRAALKLASVRVGAGRSCI